MSGLIIHLIVNPLKNYSEFNKMYFMWYNIFRNGGEIINRMYDEKGMLKPEWELTESEKRNMLKPDFCMNNPHINDMAM